MDPLSPEQTPPDPELLDKNYALGAEASVRARFKLYEYAEQYVDIDGLAIEVLSSLGRLAAHHTIVDVGAADAALSDKLFSQYFSGIYHGIDRNPNQFPDLSNLQLTVDEWRRLQARNPDQSIDFESLAQLQRNSEITLWTSDTLLRLQPGQAQNLSELLEPDSVDTLFAMFMLYHLSYEERQQAYQEFKRVLKPDGITIISTSGNENKSRHRLFERAIAASLSKKTVHTTPPDYMNAGFTSAIAMQEMGEQFEHVYIYEWKTDMLIDGFAKLNDYLKSHRSLRNQYRPEPATADFEEVLQTEVRVPILRSWKAQNTFRDNIHRTLLVCSDIPLDIPAGLGLTKLDQPKS